MGDWSAYGRVVQVRPGESLVAAYVRKEREWLARRATLVATADWLALGQSPLPLELRILGAMLMAHGCAPVTVEQLADVLNMPAISVNGALRRMFDDGVVTNVAHVGGLFWALADDFLADAGACPRMGKVVAFPVPGEPA